MDKKEFYNALSEDYDEMIDFENALDRRKNLLAGFIKKHSTALDFGCGTGVDSIALTHSSLSVDAFDISEEMIVKGRTNASNYNMSLNFYSDFSLIESSPKKYDLIISLGNTLANLPQLELKQKLYSFDKMLAKGGRMVFQIINYVKVGNADTFLIAEKETKFHKIKRFYEKLSDGIVFKILVENKTSGKSKTLQTKIYPHTIEVFHEFFDKKNYDLNYWGSLNKDSYNPNLSNDLVICSDKI